MEKKTDSTLTSRLAVVALATSLTGAGLLALVANFTPPRLTKSYISHAMEDFHSYTHPREFDPLDFESPCDRYFKGTDSYCECISEDPAYLPQDFVPIGPL